MFVQLWNSFGEELKTTKQKIIYTNVTEGLFVKKKNDIKLYYITITESTESVSHVTRQNSDFAHGCCSKNDIKVDCC